MYSFFNRIFDFKCIYASILYYAFKFIIRLFKLFSIVKEKILSSFQKSELGIDSKSIQSDSKNSLVKEVLENKLQQQIQKKIHLGFILDSEELSQFSNLKENLEILQNNNLNQDDYNQKLILNQNTSNNNSNSNYNNNSNNIIFNNNITHSNLKTYSKKLSNIIEWCSEFDTIERITFYDLKGVSKYLLQIVEGIDENFVLVEENADQAHWIYKKSLHIHAFNYQSHSHPIIIEFVKNFYEKESEFINQLDLSLHEKQKILYFKILSELENYSHLVIPKEPELIIILSKVPMLFGYNPLFLRYSEIIHHEQGLDLQKKDIMKYLDRFKQIEHRFGK